MIHTVKGFSVVDERETDVSILHYNILKINIYKMTLLSVS